MSFSIREPSTRTSVSVSLNSMDSLQPSSKVRKAGDDALRLNRSGLMKKRNMRSGSWYPTLMSPEPGDTRMGQPAGWAHSEKKWPAQCQLHIGAVGCSLQYWAMGPAELVEQSVAVNSTSRSTTNLSFISFLLKSRGLTGPGLSPEMLSLFWWVKSTATSPLVRAFQKGGIKPDRGSRACPFAGAPSEAEGEGERSVDATHGILSSLSNTSMSQLTVPPRVSIDELVRELHALPASAFDKTDEIRSLLASMPVEEASLAPYLTWDRQHYTRNLIDKTDLYELVAICWEVGQSSSVHNHRDQNCWMAAPVGKLLVENFHVEFQDIEAGKCRLLASNTVEL